MDLVLRCFTVDSVRDIIHVAGIGHGGGVRRLWGDQLAVALPISELDASPLRMEQRSTSVQPGSTISEPIWIEPRSSGRRCLSEAIASAGSVVSRWVARYSDNSGVWVLNITTGLGGGPDPRPEATRLISAAGVPDGVLLSTCHLVGAYSSDLNDADALYLMSSPTPPDLREAARQAGDVRRFPPRMYVCQSEPIGLWRWHGLNDD